MAALLDSGKGGGEARRADHGGDDEVALDRADEVLGALGVGIAGEGKVTDIKALYLRRKKACVAAGGQADDLILERE